MARPLRLALLLGLAHGVSDGAAGLLLGQLGHTLAIEQVGALVLLYNLLAFGLQPIAGMLADQVGRPRAVGVVGLLLVAAGLALAPVAALPAVALAGLGGAAFHVGAGALALRAGGGRAALPGLFAAPGVLGLAIGGALAVGQIAAGPYFLALTVGLAAWMIFIRVEPAVEGWPATSGPVADSMGEACHKQEIDGHDLIMLALLAAIALRSLVWTGLQAMMAGNIELLLGMGLAAAAGKAVGGLLADRMGWRRYCLATLAAAALLISLGEGQKWALLLGVGLLQSATPAALAAAWQLLPGRPATAAGLALGLAIAAGGLPGAIGLGPPNAAVASGAALAAALATWWALLRPGRHTTRPRGSGGLSRRMALPQPFSN